jgi:hypothetical protein
MGKGIPYKAGSVVWAFIPDRSGRNPERRPLLVIHPEPMNSDSNLCCLAISTVPDDNPADPAIEMPWNKEDGSTTGLFEWCRVVLRWHVLLSHEEVEDHTGRVTREQLARILSERDRVISFAVR